MDVKPASTLIVRGCPSVDFVLVERCRKNSPQRPTKTAKYVLAEAVRLLVHRNAQNASQDAQDPRLAWRSATYALRENILKPVKRTVLIADPVRTALITTVFLALAHNAKKGSTLWCLGLHPARSAPGIRTQMTSARQNAPSALVIPGPNTKKARLRAFRAMWVKSSRMQTIVAATVNSAWRAGIV